MAQRPHVPQFGNWESQDDVPYTIYFEKARKGKGGKMINPNDPQENPELFANIASSPARPSGTKTQAEVPTGRGGGVAVRQPPRDQRRVSREEGNFRQFVDSPGSNDNTGRRTSGDQYAHQPYGHGTNSSRTSRQSIGSDNSIELPPVHPHYQAKVRGGGGGSPAWDGKPSSESGHGTPGRSRMKPPTGGDESPDRGAAVPRFGDWDENNPQSADNYTHIFNKVREERHNDGPSNVSGSKSAESSHYNLQKQNKQPKDCCFPWFRK